MRWPWRLAPGMVRVRDREFVDVVRGALRSVELEAGIADRRRVLAGMEARVRAAELLDERAGLEAGERSRLWDTVEGDLPVTTSGELHEAAFLAVVDQWVWRDLDGRLAVTANQTGESR